MREAKGVDFTNVTRSMSRLIPEGLKLIFKLKSSSSDRLELEDSFPQFGSLLTSGSVPSSGSCSDHLSDWGTYELMKS